MLHFALTSSVYGSTLERFGIRLCVISCSISHLASFLINGSVAVRFRSIPLYPWPSLVEGPTSFQKKAIHRLPRFILLILCSLLLLPISTLSQLPSLLFSPTEQSLFSCPIPHSHTLGHSARTLLLIELHPPYSVTLYVRTATIYIFLPIRTLCLLSALVSPPPLLVQCTLIMPSLALIDLILPRSALPSLLPSLTLSHADRRSSHVICISPFFDAQLLYVSSIPAFWASRL